MATKQENKILSKLVDLVSDLKPSNVSADTKFDNARRFIQRRSLETAELQLQLEAEKLAFAQMSAELFAGRQEERKASANLLDFFTEDMVKLMRTAKKIESMLRVIIWANMQLSPKVHTSDIINVSTLKLVHNITAAKLWKIANAGNSLYGNNTQWTAKYQTALSKAEDLHGAEVARLKKLGESILNKISQATSELKHLLDSNLPEFMQFSNLKHALVIALLHQVAGLATGQNILHESSLERYLGLPVPCVLRSLVTGNLNLPMGHEALKALHILWSDVIAFAPELPAVLLKQTGNELLGLLAAPVSLELKLYMGKANSPSEITFGVSGFLINDKALCKYLAYDCESQGQILLRENSLTGGNDLVHVTPGGDEVFHRLDIDLHTRFTIQNFFTLQPRELLTEKVGKPAKTKKTCIPPWIIDGVNAQPVGWASTDSITPIIVTNYVGELDADNELEDALEGLDESDTFW
jgi:hypothetical protein